MAIPISNVTRRVVYAASGTGPYAFTFEILANTDIAVYKDDLLLTLTTDYTVTIASNGTGSITLVASPTGATQIAIVGNRTIQRTTDFVTGGDFFANTVNNELDQLTIFAQQNAEGLGRALVAPQTDPTTINMTLPRAADRAGKYLAFDADGNPEPGDTAVEVAAVYAIRDEIETVSDNISAVTTVADDLNEAVSEINTVAVNINNVNTVGGISANVTTVAGISSNVTSVAGNSTNINTVATNIANVNAVGSNIANVNAVNSNATNINAVNSNSTNINTVAGISANVTTVAGISANVTSVAGNATNITTVATEIGSVITTASNITAVQNASSNATAAAASASAAAASAAAASAVALGNEPVRHSVRPSLLLDFANAKQLDPRITFTRASTADYYDGQTVAKAEENLLIRSQEFDNASWTKVNATVTANATTAPDGASTADVVFETTTNAGHNIYQTFTSVSGNVYTYSMFVKGNGRTICRFLMQMTSSVYAVEYNLSTVATSNISGTGTATITSVGNDWYRITATATATASGTSFFNFYLQETAGATTYVGDVTKGMYLWGAQLEQRSAVTAYTATTTQAITNYIPVMLTAASGVARFDHNPVTGESLGLLIEESRTNLVTYSEQFDNAAWGKTRASITANAIVAPDGTLTGDKLVEDTTASNTHSLSQSSISVTSGTAYTQSIYAKYAGRYLTLYFSSVQFGDSNTPNSAIFNLQNGTIYSQGSALTSASIVHVGNGWYRCSVTKTATATTTFTMAPYLSDGSSPIALYTGDGFSGAYIWGAQFEAGSFATSYIPTVASQVTRAADVASMTGTNFSSWYRADEGTLYGEAQSTIGNFRSGSINPTLFCISDGSTSNFVSLMRGNGTTDSNARFAITASGAVQANVLGTNWGAGTFRKMAGSFAVNNFQAALDGAALTGDTSGVLPVVNQANIGVFATSLGFLNGTIRKIAYYPLRLTNAELQGLATV